MKELNLKELRIKNGIILKEVANDMGKSRSHVERIEKNPQNYRINEIEKYLGLIGYGVDIIEFIKECIEPTSEVVSESKIDLFTRDELNSAVEVEQRRTNFYCQENYRLIAENEKLKKENENYKNIVLKLTTEKYCI